MAFIQDTVVFFGISEWKDRIVMYPLLNSKGVEELICVDWSSLLKPYETQQKLDTSEKVSI